MPRTEALVVKYTCKCQYYPKYCMITENGGDSFVKISIPKICPECDDGDYYKLYIGRNRYQIEGIDGSLTSSIDPDRICIEMKTCFFGACLSGSVQCMLWDEF